jgi:uncharacterized protein YerC
MVSGTQMEDIQAAREEAARKSMAREKRYELANRMRAEGHTTHEISERTGLSRAALSGLFRGLGRRK